MCMPQISHSKLGRRSSLGFQNLNVEMGVETGNHIGPDIKDAMGPACVFWETFH